MMSAQEFLDVFATASDMPASLMESYKEEGESEGGEGGLKVDMNDLGRSMTIIPWFLTPA